MGSDAFPALQTSSGDTTNYSIVGCWPKSETLRLLHNNEYNNRAGHSLYHHEKVNMYAGMRFKKTHTLLAIGTTALILITISGLTKDETPTRNFTVLLVQALFPVGYVMIAKGERGDLSTSRLVDIWIQRKVCRHARHKSQKKKTQQYTLTSNLFAE